MENRNIEELANNFVFRFNVNRNEEIKELSKYSIDDIIYALVNGIGIVMSNLVEKYPIDVKEELFNDIKDVIITTIKEDIDYKSYTELDYFD